MSRAEKAGFRDGRDQQRSARDSFEVCVGVTTDKPRSQDAESAALEGRPQVGSEGKSRTLSAGHMGSAKAAAVGPDLRLMPWAWGDP